MKRKFAIVCAVISVALIFGVLNGCSAPQTGNVELPKEEVTEPGGSDKLPGDSEPLPPVADENGKDLGEGIHTLPRFMIFNTMSTDGDIVSSATVKAQLEPSYTTEKEVTWTLAWDKSTNYRVYGLPNASVGTGSLTWVADKEITDYLQLTELDELTVKITMKQSFACPVILTVVSDSNSSLKAECKVTCWSKPVVKSVTGLSAYGSEIPLVWEFSDSNMGPAVVLSRVRLDIEQTLGTQTGSTRGKHFLVEWGFSDEALAALSALDFEEKNKKIELEYFGTPSASTSLLRYDAVSWSATDFEKMFGKTFLGNAERMAQLRACAASCADNFFELTVHWNYEETFNANTNREYTVSFPEVIYKFPVGIDVDSLVAGG